MLNFTVIDYIVLGIFILERIYHIQRPWLNKKYIESAQPKTTTPHHEGISLVLCVYNEAKYLKQYLKSWIAVDYPNLEIIIVNDGSEDDSLDVIHHLTTEYSHIQMITIDHQGKRKHLKPAFKKQKYPCIALTDIDCYPNSDQWLHAMTSSFQKFRLSYWICALSL